MEISINLQLIYLSLFLFTTILIHLLAKKSVKCNNGKSKTKPIPQPPGALPIIGHLHLLGGHGTTLARTLGAMANKCGPIFALKLGKHKAIVISNWELVKDCFTNNDMITATRPSMALSKYLAYDYASFSISPYDRYWREIRKISTVELLSNKRLEKMKHVRILEVNSCLKSFYEKCVKLENNESNGVKFSLGKWFACLGFNIALCMIVGKRFSPKLYADNNSFASRFKNAIERATHLAGLPVTSDFLPWVEWMDLRGYIGAMKETHKEIDTIIGHWLNEHIQKRQDQLGSQCTSFEDRDFMDVMLSHITEPFAMSNYTKDTIIKSTALLVRDSFLSYMPDNNSFTSRFKKTIERATHLLGLPVPSDFLLWVEWMDLNHLMGYIGAMKETHKKIDTVIGHWLNEHIQKRQDQLGSQCTSFEDGDFMDVMLSHISEPFAMSNYTKDTIIKPTALTLLLTGSESTSITLTWALSLLVNNPKDLKAAQYEMDQQVGKQRWVEESDIPNLPYFQAIVKETLRLYPPSPLAGPREATEDCQVNAHCIPKGTRLIVNIWKLHRDPIVWANPDQFRPERFIKEHKDVDFKGQHFYYIPFSLGRRSCPGMNFGLQVVHLMLARLVQGFNIWSEDSGPIDMQEGLGLALPKVGPLDVMLAPRLPNELYEAI